MAEYHYICPISFQNSKQPPALFLQGRPISDALQFSPESTLPRMDSLFPDLYNQNANHIVSTTTTLEQAGQNFPVSITVLDGQKTPNEAELHGRRSSNDFPVSVTVSDGEKTPEAKHDGKEITVLIGFKLFIAKKTQQKKKSWGAVNFSHEFPVTVVIGETSFEAFQKMVASIFWYGSIPRCPKWAKKDRVKIGRPSLYHKWLETACDLDRSKVVLAIHMTNPSKVAQWAEMEDLLAAQVLRDEAAQVAASKRKSTKADSDGGESDELDPEDWDNVNVHMHKLFKKHLVNTMYNRLTPIFIDPSNPHRYILLTEEACSTWAKALIKQKDGVSLESPPSSLKYIMLSPAKQAALDNSSVAGTSTSTVTDSNIQLIAQLLAGRNQMTPTISGRSDSVMSSPPNKSHIEGYLDFLGVCDKECTLEILLANGFHLHKTFKLTGLLCSEVKDLGLSLGVVTMLFDNATKYNHHLAANRL
ncbi:hypothetical protein PCASD_20201 [Puccinia coronata f. sp. avenae]|uniref:Uncharacterized protein n=1 Tax=Puccinia coronata f. sp. avenae TaxID=200324 RepID=A0A2N5SDZ5_9BASI|nr:hypothetical protein PCASD_20201 [Puccinia coronata f. sp. avenae]